MIEALNSSGNPATLTGTLTVSLLSNSMGEYQFLASSLGPTITALTLSPGSNSATFYYQDEKAANPTLTASAPSLSSANLPIGVLPGAFSRLQVLLPGEIADPGRPNANPVGHTGNPSAEQAGYPFQVLVNSVDAFFNLASTTGSITLSSTDPRASLGSSQTLSNGSATFGSVILYTPGSVTITASGVGSPAPSDPVSVLPGSLSTLNVTHGTPQLSTVQAGQSFNVLTFDFAISGGSDPVSILSMIFHAEDSSGNPVAIGSAFQDFTLSTAVTTYTIPVTGASDLVTLGQSSGVSLGLVPGSNLPVTLGVIIAASPSAKDALISLDNAASVSAQDPVTQTVAQVTALGDSTGFPMQSQLMLFLPPDVASTYGNYPNPFHPSQGSTTIEFNLQAASTVSLVLYDVMGGQVVKLADNQNLPAGLQRILWDGRNGMGSYVLNGIYYAQLTVNGQKYLLKIAVVK